VSFVDPFYIGPQGLANDDHPHADLRLGQEFISDVAGAFVESPDFRRSALFITYDEWGGFWDHVRPPKFPDDRASANLAQDFGQGGFRVPTVVVSPWTQGGKVHHGVYDHASIIKFVADNWGTGYLTKRHRLTNSIGASFGGFTSYRPEADLVSYTAPLSARLDVLLQRLQRQVATSDVHRLAELGWFETLGIRTDWRLEDSFRSSRAAIVAPG
jgi:phospholipase C